MLDPGKYRILDTRTESWIRVLADRGVAFAHDGEPSQQNWLRVPRPPDHLHRVRRVEPVRPGGLTLLLATRIVDDAPFGVDVGLTGPDLPVSLLASEPDCGCDACDHGSGSLLEGLDGWWLAVLRGGLVHLRD